MIVMSLAEKKTMTEAKNDFVQSDELDDSSFTLSVSQGDVGDRIDRYITDATGQSRSLIVKLIEGGSVTVNGKKVEKNYKMRAGDSVEVEFPEPVADEAVAEDIPLDVVYEDSDIIVINKPKGMIVHPATGIYTGTLVNALL